MASETKRPQGCSGCLIDAIERHDKRRLRNLLSASNVKYSDNYWVPREQLCQFMTPFSNSITRFPMLTTDFLYSKHQCVDPVVEETLMQKEPANIAMSVVLVSMLHTTAQFNAFQIVVESRKFDLKEPLIFHLKKKTKWPFLIVDPAIMALLLDKNTDIDDRSNCFLLLKTLCRNRSINLERDLQAIEIHNTNNWIVHRGRGPFSFLYSLYYSSSSLGGLTDSQSEWLMERLKALILMNLCLNRSVCLYNTYYLDFRALRKHQKKCSWKNKSVISALFNMFCTSSNANIEYYVGQLILYGWIGVGNDDPDHAGVLFRLLHQLLLSELDLLQWESLFRIARQLFALGLFRQRGESLFHFYLVIILKHLERKKRKFPVARVFSLRSEFFRNALSLLQLSRASIRCQFGMNDFERRVRTLPLPPLLLKYVWRANEMLKGVAPPEGADPQKF